MRSSGDSGGSPRFGMSNPGTYWIIIACVTIFLLELIGSRVSGHGSSRWFSELFALSSHAFQSGKVWTVVTYGLLHGTFIHILFNMLGLFFIGRILEPILGTQRLVILFGVSVLLGGIAWLLFGGQQLLVGASGGVLGVLIYFCCMYPNRSITLLLFFVLPVTIKPKWIIVFMVVTNVLGLFSMDPMGGMMSAAIGYEAHLGGMLGGFVCFYWFTKSIPNLFGSENPYAPAGGGISMEPPKWFKQKKKKVVTETKYKVNVVSRNKMEEEVNRILDKINTEGFGALTIEEKETLDRAKDFLKGKK